MFKKIIALMLAICMLFSLMLQTAVAGRTEDNQLNIAGEKQAKKVDKPIFSPDGGKYDSPQTVEISCATPDATIFYTTDGSVPNRFSDIYRDPITISESATIKAFAVKDGMKDSPTVSAKYTIAPSKAAAPTFSPAGGTYHSTQSVILVSATEGATILYTIDGKTPNKHSAVYTEPIIVSCNTTIKAYAEKKGVKNSDVVTAVYVILPPLPQAATPAFSPAEGTYDSAQNITISCATGDATIHYTLDGRDPGLDSPIYSEPIAVSGTTTIKAYAVKEGMLDSAIASATYTLNLPGDPWSLVWSDDFDGPAVDTNKWNFENKGDGFGNNEAQYYKPDNAVIEDGKLVIQARKETYGGCNYTSAKLMTQGKADWKYGKIEASIKLPLGQGFWPAFWMMPADNEYGGWAGSGEIDIMEAKGRLPYVVGGTLHYGSAWPNNVYTGKNYNFPEGESIADFHTYGIEWEPGEIRWYVDGKLYQTQTNWYTNGANGDEKYSFPAPFDQDFYLILNLAIGGNFDGGLMPADDLFPAQMEVDYVKVYELTGRPYKTPVEPGMEAEPLPPGAREPDSTGNLAADVNFEQGIKDNAEGADDNFGEQWNYVHNAQFGGVATATVDAINGKNYAKIDVIARGSQPYSVQLEQLTTLGKGRWYKFSFDAKADKNRTLAADLGGGPTAGWNKYSGSYTVNLTTSFQHFEYEFQMTKDSDILTRIEYNCATDTGPVWIGNVRVEEIAPPVVDYTASKAPLPDSGNYIYNGAFDKYTIDRMAYWNVEKTGADATVGVPESTRELTVDITDGGTTPDAVAVNQKGVQLTKGSNYKLSFNARADANRTIKVRFANRDESLVYAPDKDIALTAAMEYHEVTFKMEADTDLESQLAFLLGGGAGDVFIDDVLLVKTSVDYSNIELYPLKNGDFSQGLAAWGSWIGEGGAGTVSVVDGEAQISVSNAGNQPWSLQFYQSSLVLAKDIEYVVSFDVRSSKARNMEISLENSAYTRRLTTVFAAGPETTHYEYTFTMPVTEEITLKYLLGKTDAVAAGLGDHDILIDNVVCEVKDAKYIASVVENGRFIEGLAPWMAWTGDGGAADVNVVNEELKIAVTSAGPNSWSVQAYQEGLEFESGKTYRLSFKARADAARKVNVNIGKALTVDPWFTAYMPMQTYDLTGNMQEFVYEFTMTQPTYDNAKIVFEAGNVAGGNAATNIYIDDVAVNEITLPPPEKTNLALNRPAYASTSLNPNVPAAAFDGIASTRWESVQAADPQWLYVDIGASLVSGFKLTWETAAGREYKIQASNDGVQWTDVYVQNNGTNGAIVNYTFTAPISAEFMRMYGTSRTTAYGYSIYEWEIYGELDTTKAIKPVISPAAGSYSSQITVSMTDTTLGAQIYYTTDGTVPAASNGTLYTGPFILNSSTTVKAVAVKSGLSDSNVATSVFTVLPIATPTGIAKSSTTGDSVTLYWNPVTGADGYNVYRSTTSDGTYEKLTAVPITSARFTDTGLIENTTYYYKVSAVNAYEESPLSAPVEALTVPSSEPDFGPNVVIIDPTMPIGDVSARLTSIFNQMERNQFGDERYAILFKPGTYDLTQTLRIGFYTQVAGLGASPDDVTIGGSLLGVDAGWFAGNATQNFWRAVENLSVAGDTKWAVSQATAMRRVHIKGNLRLADGGWSSGGFIANSLIDGSVSPESQQQWLSRNSKWGSWASGVWNMVFVGDDNTPAGTWPAVPYTTVDKVPAVKEKPYLTIDASGHYSVFVPALKTDSKGVAWTGGAEAGTSIPLSDFYIAHPETDTAATLNAALDEGKHLLLTPGVYYADEPIQVNNPNTIVLGMGYATLRPTNGNICMKIADVDGIQVAGILFDAGTTSSPVLMEIGQEGSSADHSANPTVLNDMFFRVGGAYAGKVETCVTVNSDDVIGDNFWVWRADHGNGVGWNVNTTKNGMIVNGDDVTMYGLFVEHFHEYQTIWNGNGGRTYFYQSEFPYDVPDQASWMSHDGTVNGYASYKVADSVTSHEAWGLGMYSNFTGGVAKVFSAMEVPLTPGVKVHNICSVYLSGSGEITHVINEYGATAIGGNMRQIITEWPAPSNTVAAPVFTPAPGAYTAAQMVTISCATADAVIHYTTNGDTPNASSPVYTGPITVVATTTIKAYALKAGLADSPVTTGVYIIYIPQTTSTLYPGNTAVSSVTPAGLSFVADAPAAGGWTPTKTVSATPLYWYSTPLTGSYAEGSWSFIMWTDSPAAPVTSSIVEVSLYKVNVDGSGAEPIGSPQTCDIKTTGGGNHTSTYTFITVPSINFINQRLMLKVVRVGGDGNCTMAYWTKDFPTRLTTPVYTDSGNASGEVLARVEMTITK